MYFKEILCAMMENMHVDLQLTSGGLCAVLP